MLAPRSLTDGRIFANHALQLRAHGLAVLPAEGKKTLISGWRQWHGLPSTKAINQLARQFPEANIAILPGPSRLFVADIDSADQVEEVEKLLGPTPLHVATGRGCHLFYRNTKGCEALPANLAAIGLKTDLKAGNSIVIVPPSKHQSGAVYRLDGCDWGALRELPPPNLQQLRRLIEKPALAVSERYAEGQRGLGLNRLLCRHAAYAETFEDLLDVARTCNDDFLPPIENDAEVVKRTRQVWKDARAGKIQPWVGGKAVARARDTEINRLCEMGRNGPDAVALLIKLRNAHGARSRRRETFALAAEAMAREGTIPGWPSKRYVAARELLLRAGYLVRVVKHQPRQGGGGRPALYSLVGAT